MLIELRNINKRYDEKCNPLRNINLKIEAGECVAIVGPSGVGKSSLLNILGCVDKQTSGDYILDGSDISAYSKKEMAQLRNKMFGYILQDNGLIEYRDVYDNVAIPLMFNGSIKKSEYHGKISSALKNVGLEGYSNKTINNLSGGEKQRVAIARAIVNSPKVILADEPTGSLDVDNKENIIDLLFELNNQGSTLIVVTHDLEMAGRFPTRYRFTKEGLLIKED